MTPSSSSGLELGWALVGASMIAEQGLLPAVHEVDGVRAVGILSSSPERGAAFAERCGLPKSYGSLDELLADPAVDIVYVSTSNERHAAPSIAAAQAGRHVLCEKPLATTLEDAAAMLDAARRGGVTLATCHHITTLPHVAKIRELVRAGEAGDVIAMRTVGALDLSSLPKSWRFTDPNAGPGPVFDLGTHQFDLTRYVLDDEIEAVTAMGVTHGVTSPPIADDVQGLMRTAGGRLASFHSSYVVFGTNVIEVVGTKGVLTTILDGPMAARQMDHVTLQRPGAEPERIPVDPGVHPFVATVMQMSAAARGEGKPVRTGDDGERSLAVAVAALTSVAEGRTVPVAAAR